MNQRIRYIIGPVGILCLAGFALAPAPVQAIPLGAGISTIHQTTVGNGNVVVQVRVCPQKKPNNRGCKKTQ
jgi:hypothetical protein